MSWFQSTNITSLAKSALKEAQKTIDKALEIGDTTPSQTQTDASLSSSTSEKVAAVTEAATDFFASWGVGAGKKLQKIDEGPPSESNNTANLIANEEIKPPQQQIQVQMPHDEDDDETLTTVDLNSTEESAEDLISSYHHHYNSSSNSMMMLNSDNNYSNSWSWAETSGGEIIKPHQEDEQEEANKTCQQEEDHSEPLIFESDSIDMTKNQHEQSQNDTITCGDDIQLESSSGTMLFDQSLSVSGGAVLVDAQEQDRQQTQRDNFQSSSRSSSPLLLVLHNDNNNDEHNSNTSSRHHHHRRERGSSTEDEEHCNNFELLSNDSSKLDSNFLPESSRSSSIVVVSSTRASSGGSSGSTEESSSDIHRDIDMLESTLQHHSSSITAGPTSSFSDPTSPEFINKSKSKHRKGPSSASSSDIEVILSSEYKSHSTTTTSETKSMSSTQTICLEFQNQETQTIEDYPPIKQSSLGVIEEIPDRITNEIASIIDEKDQAIEQLREEGEKLSKKSFELSQIIKKLRVKEKELDNTVKTLKGELAGRNVENDRLVKGFVNKECTEKTLNDTVQKLTTEKRTLELKIEQIISELEDAQENCASMKVSVEEASVEILELKNAISSAQRDSTELDNLTRDKSDLLSRNESLSKELDNLRSTNNLNQQKSFSRETEHKNQIDILTRKVHSLENQLSDMSSEVADVTMPLSLEIEKLQAELKQSQSSHEKRETLLNSQVLDLESKLKTCLEKEGSLKDQITNHDAIVSFFENKIQELEIENRKLKQDASFREENEHKQAQQNDSKFSKMESQIQKLTTEIERLNQENESLGLDLKAETNSLEQERKRNQTLLEQLSSTSIGRNINQQQHKASIVSSSNNFVMTNNKSGENSPARSSVTSEASYLDEVFDPHGQHRGGITPRSSMMFDSFSSTGLLEQMQCQLRQRENELSQFQDEIQKNEKIRKSLNEEIAKLTMRNHEFQLETERLSELEPKLKEMETNYNTLLQLYGEKVEEADELRLDLIDVKKILQDTFNKAL